MSIYGQIPNDLKTSMIFDKVYPNRSAMESAIYGNATDGVFSGRFVLIDYSMPDPSKTTEGLTEIQVYSQNYDTDKARFGNSIGSGYDGTVWRKIIDTDGNESYNVQVAALNSAVPTFSLTVDNNPTMEPYFDEDSNNVVYNLHIGGPWQVGTSTTPDIGSQWLNPDTVFDGSVSNEASNTRVTLTQQNNKIALDVKLPIVGAAVGTMYNAIYGPNRGFNLSNPLDAPSRLVEDVIEDSVSDPDNVVVQRMYDVSRLDNVYSAISSLYDLMGRNVDTSLADESFQQLIDRSDFDTIYYFHSTEDQNHPQGFYYKDYVYNFDDTDLVDSDLTGVKANQGYAEYPGTILSDATPNLYRKKTQTITDPLWRDRIGNRNEEYTAVAVGTELQPDVDYYTLNSAYVNMFDENHQVVDPQSETFESLRDGVGLYLVQGSVSSGITLHKVTSEESQDITKTYYEITSNTSSVKSYFPRVTSTQIAPTYQTLFRTYEDTLINAYPSAPSDANAIGWRNHIFYRYLRNINTIYPQPTINKVLEPVGITEHLSANAQAQENLTHPTGNNPKFQLPSLVIYEWPNFNPGSISGVQDTLAYVLEHSDEFAWVRNANGDYIWSQEPPAPAGSTDEERIDDIKLNGIETYSLVLAERENFYVPGTYYWGTNSDNTQFWRYINTSFSSVYNLSTGGTPDTYLPAGGLESGSAYKGLNGQNVLPNDNPDPVYFVPNQVYTANHELATTYTNGAQYYIKCEVAVYNDPLGVFEAGELWNLNLSIDDINANRNSNEKLQVRYKLAEPTLLPLADYARTTNTINQWLLKFNRFMGQNSGTAIRTSSTLQGSLNILNDKIKGLGNLSPESLVVTDAYGHLNAAVIGTNSTNDWLTLSTDIVNNTPVVTVTHKINSGAGAVTTSSFQPSVTGSILTIKSPSIDTAGHIIGVETLTAQLPSADLQLTMDDWITATGTQNTWTFSHAASSTTTASSVAPTATTLSFGDSFTIPSVAIDAKGHVNSLSAITVTLPSLDLTDITSSVSTLSTNLGTLSATVSSILTTLSGWHNITISTATPNDSNGSNGDIWIKVVS